MPTQSDKVYVIGPPVRDLNDLTDLLQQCWRKLCSSTTLSIRLRADGPVVYKSFWMLQGQGRQRLNRPGMGALELWCEKTDGSQQWKLEFNLRNE